MHRNTNVLLNGLAIIVSTFIANGVLEAAAPIYGWSDKHVIYYLKIMICAQGALQGFISWFAQAYNTDGTKPGTVVVTTEKTPPGGRTPESRELAQTEKGATVTVEEKTAKT